jgi:hypothetical protein
MSIFLPMLFFAGIVFTPDVVAQRNPRGSFTDVGFSISGGPMQAFGEHSATQGDFSAHLNVIHLRNFSYTGVGVEASYRGDANLELFSIMARIEAGLKEGRPVGRNVVGFNTLYAALMAGYATGTAWDEAYIDLYDSFEEVAVSVNGIPIYAALGWRRIGRMGLNIEAIGGLTIITSQQAEESVGTAPSLIPGIGLRVGIGFDTFFYSR